jgi:hypothetical protein
VNSEKDHTERIGSRRDALNLLLKGTRHPTAAPAGKRIGGVLRDRKKSRKTIRRSSKNIEDILKVELSSKRGPALLTDKLKGEVSSKFEIEPQQINSQI